MPMVITPQGTQRHAAEDLSTDVAEVLPEALNQRRVKVQGLEVRVAWAFFGHGRATFLDTSFGNGQGDLGQ